MVGASSTEDADEINKLLADIETRASMEKVSLQIDPWAATGTWWKSEITIDGLPTLTMLTQNAMPALAEENMPTIYVPGRGSTHVLVRPMSRAVCDEAYLGRARIYTERLFSIHYSSRLKPGAGDFSYLFLPVAHGANEQVWQDRRQWHQDRLKRGVADASETRIRANADALRHEYGSVTDLSLISPHRKFKRPPGICCLG